ncbi:hypothetical protein ACVWZA_002443 [Sphingomonas sp. UYAg733]
MQIPFEHDGPADPIAPVEPPLADQVVEGVAVAAPAEMPADPEPLAAEPVRAMVAMPEVEAVAPIAPDGDAGAARRRITMRLYSRMMADLKVLTGDKRLATD